jgi:hypothetical protein
MVEADSEMWCHNAVKPMPVVHNLLKSEC